MANRKTCRNTRSIIRVSSAHIFAALLIAVAILGGCRFRQGPKTDEVKVEVATVDIDRDSGAPFVLLEDRAGKRALQIGIGETEARSILMEMHGIVPPRPFTSDLLRTLLQRTGNHVDRIVISDLRKETYYANIYLDRGRYLIDSRPSDAIALALGTNAPIYVAARLLEAQPAAGQGAPTHGPELTRALGLTVQEISAEIADYFQVAPGSGLLVADVSPQAAKAGVARGDLLLKVGNADVRSLADLNRQLASLKEGSVLLTVRRGATEHLVTVPVGTN